MEYIKKFEEITLQDLPLVGGKNANLGQMIHDLLTKGITIPTGFAITAQAYWHFLEHNKFIEPIKKIMSQLTDYQDIQMLQKVGHKVRELIISGTIPDDLAQEIMLAYVALSQKYNQKEIDVAVRSSATAEDLPTASFAGQQETYLNVRAADLLEAYKKCLASLFTNRAIVYRIEQGFDHFKVALSVGIQKMVRSDLACSGVAFSLDTESGFKDVIMIESSYGLGETIVKGLVTPDEFLVHTPTLKKGFKSIIKKELGEKRVKMVYAQHKEKTTEMVDVLQADQQQFSLTADEILELAKQVATIEQQYTELKSAWSPMDVEWAKDGNDNKIYILQARPETIHAVKKETVITTYALKNGDPHVHKAQLITTGLSIGQQIASGEAKVIFGAGQIDQVQDGDIIVTDMTDPDWVPAMKRAAGIITNRGGRTCHAAIVSRELGIPAIVGTANATQKITKGEKITIDCSRGNVGFIYEGEIPFTKTETKLETIPKAPVELLVNIADPDSAFQTSFLPVDGVGLARLEFIITNYIKVHPMALIHPDRVSDKSMCDEIERLVAPYNSKKDFFVEKLSEGIGMIAAAFYPRPVIVRFSDFKTNEYRNLIGGTYFEPEEENPMLGFRGASRYYHENYKAAFALECAAFVKVRNEMGLDNIKPMVPFVRTTKEAELVIQELKQNGLKCKNNNLEIVMMCEVPSNVIVIDEFAQLFDGFSIGSNDLTQLTLGVDRDSELLAPLFDERDSAVKKMMGMAIEGAKRNKKYIGICGQAPSDYPKLAHFLIKQGITSLSLNSDSVIPFLMRYKK